jgi:activator of 2-hydroxyglutaryl-CoA dehydratase
MVNCNSYQKESVQLSSNLGIAKVSNMINPEVVNKEVSTKVNHVFCVDISGSMWRELKSIRTQLKARLSEIVSNDDTITLIYFADGKDVGIVKEFAQLKTKDDILELNKLIDKYIVSK